MRYAHAAFRDGFYAHVCFIAQQASEKALKSMLFKRGAKLVLSHSLHKLCQELKINGELEVAAKTLDLYYISSRYPDALIEGVPAEVFQKKHALEALEMAELFISTAQGT